MVDPAREGGAKDGAVAPAPARSAIPRAASKRRLGGISGGGRAGSAIEIPSGEPSQGRPLDDGNERAGREAGLRHWARVVSDAVSRKPGPASC